MPYFFSDLFDFGFEAVGTINEDMETFSSWEEEYETGVVYYLKENKVRGAMMCNLWGKVDQARELIKADKKVSPKDLKGALN